MRLKLYVVLLLLLLLGSITLVAPAALPCPSLSQFEYVTIVNNITTTAVIRACGACLPEEAEEKEEGRNAQVAAPLSLVVTCSTFTPNPSSCMLVSPSRASAGLFPTAAPAPVTSFHLYAASSSCTSNRTQPSLVDLFSSHNTATAYAASGMLQTTTTATETATWMWMHPSCKLLLDGAQFLASLSQQMVRRVVSPLPSTTTSSSSSSSVCKSTAATTKNESAPSHYTRLWIVGVEPPSSSYWNRPQEHEQQTQNSFFCSPDTAQWFDLSAAATASQITCATHRDCIPGFYCANNKCTRNLTEYLAVAVGVTYSFTTTIDERMLAQNKDNQPKLFDNNTTSTDSNATSSALMKMSVVWERNLLVRIGAWIIANIVLFVVAIVVILKGGKEERGCCR